MAPATGLGMRKVGPQAVSLPSDHILSPVRWAPHKLFVVQRTLPWTGLAVEELSQPGEEEAKTRAQKVNNMDLGRQDQ